MGFRLTDREGIVAVGASARLLPDLVSLQGVIKSLYLVPRLQGPDASQSDPSKMLSRVVVYWNADVIPGLLYR